MKTHAVPHEIMSVEFKLFGNFLSLREFIYIAIGVAVAYLFYFLMNKGIVPGVLAFPAIFFFGLGGIMVGLLPIQDKSLDQWIVNYFVAIRRPTQRVWKKEGYQPQTDTGDPVSERDQIIVKNHLISPPTQPKVATSTDSAAQTSSKTDVQTITAEKEEQSELARIDKTIGQIEKRPTPQSAPPATTGTNVTSQATIMKSTAPASPSPATSAQSPSSTAGTTAAPVSTPSASQQKSAAAPTKATETTQTTKAPPQPLPPNKEQSKQDSAGDTSNVISIDSNNISDYATNITSLESNENTINIVVKDANGLILPGVVCVIKNAHGDPVRAAISNVLGQILNNVPLKSGTYRINLTKQGYIFPEIIRTLDGETYPPIEIKSL